MKFTVILTSLAILSTFALALPITADVQGIVAREPSTIALDERDYLDIEDRDYLDIEDRELDEEVDIYARGPLRKSCVMKDKSACPDAAAQAFCMNECVNVFHFPAHLIATCMQTCMAA